MNSVRFLCALNASLPGKTVNHIPDAAVHGYLLNAFTNRVKPVDERKDSTETCFCGNVERSIMPSPGIFLHKPSSSLPFSGWRIVGESS